MSAAVSVQLKSKAGEFRSIKCCLFSKYGAKVLNNNIGRDKRAGERS